MGSAYQRLEERVARRHRVAAVAAETSVMAILALQGREGLAEVFRAAALVQAAVAVTLVEVVAEQMARTMAAAVAVRALSPARE